MNLEKTAVISTPDPAVDVSFHLVPYPAGVGYASVSCSTTKGLIHVTRTHGNESQSQTFLPDSPIYNIQNSSSAGNLIVPLESGDGRPIVVLITFDNNRKIKEDGGIPGEDGIVTVVVALSYPPADKQQRVLLKRKLPPQQSTAVHIVFMEV
jgi:hypothetical protein